MVVCSYFADTSTDTRFPIACSRAPRSDDERGERVAVARSAVLEVHVDPVVAVLARQLDEALDRRRAHRPVRQDGVQGRRVLAVEARVHLDAAQLRPPRDQRIVAPGDRAVRGPALEIGRIDGADLAVVALEIAEALAGRREQERVGAALRRRRAARW